MQFAKGDFIIIMDADLSHHVSDKELSISISVPSNTKAFIS